MFANKGQILGHEFAGIVVAVGSNVQVLELGDRVTAWPIVPCDHCRSCIAGNWHLCENALGSSISSGIPGGFAEYVRVPHARLGRTVYRIPEAVDWITGTLIEPLSVAIRAATLASVQPTDVVLVTGLGALGLCVVRVLKSSGVGSVIGVEPSARRRKAAVRLGADLVLDPSRGDLADQLRNSEQLGAGGYPLVDAVLECSGSAEALQQGIELVRPAGRVVLVGLHGQATAIDLNRILVKELTLFGAYAYRTEFDEAIRLLADGQLRQEALVSHTFPLDEIEQAFAVQSDPADSVKVIVTQVDPAGDEHVLH